MTSRRSVGIRAMARATVRRLERADHLPRRDRIVLRFRANAFLHQMVRAMSRLAGAGGDGLAAARGHRADPGGSRPDGRAGQPVPPRKGSRRARDVRPTLKRASWAEVGRSRAGRSRSVPDVVSAAAGRAAGAVCRGPHRRCTPFHQVVSMSVDTLPEASITCQYGGRCDERLIILEALLRVACCAPVARPRSQRRRGGCNGPAVQALADPARVRILNVLCQPGGAGLWLRPEGAARPVATDRELSPEEAARRRSHVSSRTPRRRY